MNSPRAIGRIAFHVIFAAARALRRHGRIVEARRWLSWCWRSGLWGWADRTWRRGR